MATRRCAYHLPSIVNGAQLQRFINKFDVLKTSYVPLPTLCRGGPPNFCDECQRIGAHNGAMLGRFRAQLLLV